MAGVEINYETHEITVTVDYQEKGDTPYIGENSNWWISGIDTGKRAQGDKGDTPVIGENGNWFVSGVDTGQKSQGNPFTYPDFTPEQLEGLKVKGDKGDNGDTVMDVNTSTGVGPIQIWTGTVQEEKDIAVKDPNVIYFSRKG